MDMPLPDYQQMTRMWLDFAAKMAGAGAAASGSVPNDAAKQVRDAYLQSLSQSTEQYMRSPQFLEAVKQSTDTAVALRKQTNDFLAKAHQAVGSLSRQDLDSLLTAVRRCESRVLERLDEVTAKIGELEARLASQESRRGARKSK